MRTRPTPRDDAAFQPVVMRGSLPGDVFEELVAGRAEVIVLLRREFRSLSVSVLPPEGDRLYPTGTVIRRIALAIVP